MEILKKASASDIYLVLQGVAYDAVYNALHRVLKPQDMIFAQIKKGVGVLNWVHPETGWQSYSEADASTRALIMGEIIAKQDMVLKEISSIPTLAKIADSLFMTPGDEYYFYRSTGLGEIEVLITGWGYKKPIRHEVKEIQMEIQEEQVQSVTIGFTADGMELPNNSFTITPPSSGKSQLKKTNENGEFFVGNRMPVGVSYIIADVETGKTFTLKVEKGKSHYIYDLSMPKAANETLEGKNEEHPRFSLDETPEFLEPKETGKDLGMPYPDNDKKDTELMSQEPEPPKEVLTEITIDVILQVEGTDGWHPVRFPIDVTVNGLTARYLTDENGQIALPTLTAHHWVTEGYAEPAVISIEVNEALDHSCPAIYDLVPEQKTYLYQIPYSNRETRKDIVIRTEDEYGKPLEGNVCFKQEGHNNVWSMLDEGVCYLNDDDFALEIPISIEFYGGTRSIPATSLKLSKEEHEYLLSLRSPKSTAIWKEVLASLLGAAAIFGVYVLLNTILL